MNSSLGALLRAKLNERRGLLVPGCGNALAARVIETLRFEAVYLSGAGLTNSFYGIPDLGFIHLGDVVQHTAAVRDAVQLPLIVDADTGFGNALNVRQTVRALERAGANAIQLEDQVMPKKCGHFAGKGVIDAGEMVGKIRAAADARSSSDFLLIARTDARAVHGLEDALERAQRYAEAGADVTFVEAPTSAGELERIAQLPLPQVVNVVIGGKTPALPTTEFARMGFGMVLYANAALQGAVRGMTNALSQLQQQGILEEDPALVATFAERQALVHKHVFDELNRRYGA
ncbi:carboxyvinyl-carboxyphosphonate phosphorylmutase [Variovorax sp. WS11]|uniref:isocitrate lyase/PEP mutase family protein n=1 Tax=Variovorax sp. WS11 TaxID=1105204 RepID=UPI000D0CC7CE|nr:oxaloacetate decarboxylase [Variovorax sp. WS11]NDZ18934.1 oxaloacetate decarboxylase [Variovorax sp. WS11]PSL82500.1 carboxyvinyl-carboxyphosphonate phosphorylmutase [Variovorax sp. WS11]